MGKASAIERPAEPGVAVTGELVKTAGMGGAFEGASRLGRELMTFRPRVVSADGSMSQRDKYLVDARGRDLLRNVGPMQGAAYTYKDSIVGSQYRLNAHPAFRVLGLDDAWADEFQIEVEEKFTLWAEADENWIDASRMNNLTSFIRLAIGCRFAGGEMLATSEWRDNGSRPYATCMQMVDCDRLSNPNDLIDSDTMRRGIEYNRSGEPIAAHIRMAHPSDHHEVSKTFKWKRVPIRKPWGRLQVLHLIEQNRPAQTRGVADMVAVLKETRMGKSFHEITLQNAIVNASYAAAIESELPTNLAFASIGAEDGADGMVNAQLAMLTAIAEYARGGRNLEIDGVKIPHLYPGSKLKMMPAGTIGGVGESFEESLNRWISRGLGISYEEYTNDFTKTNYSSSKAAANNTRKRMNAEKRAVADRVANAFYSLWLEEAISKGTIESLKSIVKRNPRFFYEGMNKQALCRASWIGAGVGQVDEMKETQAAVMRIKSGLSTLEKECARLGEDYRDVLMQAAREKKQMEALGLSFDQDATKPGTMSSQRGKGDNDDAKAAAYANGDIDQDGFDENGNRPFDDGFD